MGGKPSAHHRVAAPSIVDVERQVRDTLIMYGVAGYADIVATAAEGIAADMVRNGGSRDDTRAYTALANMMRRLV